MTLQAPSMPESIVRILPVLSVCAALVVTRSLGVSAQPQTPDRTSAVRASLVDGSARNVILFLGDATGDSEITLARNYALGEAGRLAMDTLPFAASSGPGFFLQIEGALIDKQSHNADPCGQIGETLTFDRAVKLGLEYADAHPGTLVVCDG